MLCMYHKSNFIIVFSYFRKCVGIEQNFVTFVTNMLDYVKDTTMKFAAMASQIILLLWDLQGRLQNPFFFLGKESRII